MRMVVTRLLDYSTVVNGEVGRISFLTILGSKTDVPFGLWGIFSFSPPYGSQNSLALVQS